MIASYIVVLKNVFESGNVSPDLLVGNLLQGLILAGLAVGIYQGIDWVRWLYLAFHIFPLLFAIGMSGTSVMSGLLSNVEMYFVIATCVILFLPSVRGWFASR